MKETNFKRCFINGKKCAVADYDNETSRVLYFSQSLGAGIGVEDLRAAGISCHQFNNSWEIPSADVAGIQSVIAGAVVHFDGSKEFQALSAAAAGSRPGGGNSGGKTSAASSAAAEDAETATAAAALPAVDASGVLSDALTAAAGPLGGALVSAVLPAVNAWGAGLVDETAKTAKPSGPEVHHFVDINGITVGKCSGKLHPLHAKLLDALRLSKITCQYPFIYGPAGAGKTHICKQLAAALGVPFYYCARINESFDLFGCVDITHPGKIIPTDFYRAWGGGGVLLVDEPCNCEPRALDSLLGALGNKLASFGPEGMIEQHPDFYVIFADNSDGRGGVDASGVDYGRAALSPAFRDRVCTFAFDYDPEIERALSDDESADFIQAVRAGAKVCNIPEVFSPRASRSLAAVRNCKSFSAVDALESYVFKGLETDQINQIARNITGSGYWFTALKELLKQRGAI